MIDKERILMALLTQIYAKAMYAPMSTDKWKRMQPPLFEPLQEHLFPGDLVMASTSWPPNPYMVGFVHKVENDHIVIREIGSKRLCNYYNERFYKFDKDIIGYEILEGVQYQIYLKAQKAIANASYGFCFHSISFDGNECALGIRKKFQDEKLFEVKFKTSSKTTIKSITELIEEGAKNYETV